jgi:hypothetical protein
MLVALGACAAEPEELGDVGTIELAVTGTHPDDVGYLHFAATNTTSGSAYYDKYIQVFQAGGQPRATRTFALPVNTRITFTIGFTDLDQAPLGEQRTFDYIFARGERLRISDSLDTSPGRGTIAISFSGNSAPMIDELELPADGSVTSGSPACVTVHQVEDFDDSFIYTAYVSFDPTVSMSPGPNDAPFSIHTSYPATQCFVKSGTPGVHAVDACACDDDWCECTPILCNSDSVDDTTTGIPANSCEVGDDGRRIYRFNLDTASGDDLMVIEQKQPPGGSAVVGVTFRYDGDGNNANGLEATLFLAGEEVVARGFPPQNLGTQTVFKLLTKNPATGQVTEHLFTGTHATGVVTVTSSVVTPGST